MVKVTSLLVTLLFLTVSSFSQGISGFYTTRSAIMAGSNLVKDTSLWFSHTAGDSSGIRQGSDDMEFFGDGETDSAVFYLPVSFRMGATGTGGSSLGGGMIYPGAGIALSTGTAWTTSITDNSSNWNTAYSTRIATFTTTGSSGAATFAGNTLNIPTYTLSGLGGFANPMTTGGDIIYGGASGTPTRLANGTSGFVLKSNGSTNAPSWQSDRSDTAYNGNRSVTRSSWPSGVNVGTASTMTAFLDEIFFPSQPPTASITNITTSSVLEKRSAGSTSITLRWQACKQNTTQNISTISVIGSSKIGFSQPSANCCVAWSGGSCGAAYGDTAISITNNSNGSWSILVTTIDAKIASSSTSVSWTAKRYWGRASTGAASSAEVLATLGGSSELTESKTHGGFTVASGTTPNANGSNHVFFAYPASSGTLTSITMGGFESIAAFTLAVVSVTNALGYTTNYNVYTSNNAFSETTPIIITN